MKKYITPAIDRDQQTLLRETLEESLPDGHPVRSLDFIIEHFDFEKWECEYAGGGRPAYTPQDMCKLLIYGSMVGINSSRKLEYACMNNRDFIWLLRGLAPDHDTIANFRKKYKPRFKEMFKESVRVGIEAGIISMRRIAIDGSRVLSNSARRGTADKEKIERLLENIDSKIEKILADAASEDRIEDDLFGTGESPNILSGELADAKKRKELLEKALERVLKKAERAEREGKPSENKRVPLTDPDSDVMKCKDGGFAPNYNVHIAVDCESGMIVANGVDDEHRDVEHLEKLCEESMATTGKEIEQVLADSDYTSTENLEYLDDRGIDACMPPYQTSERKREKKKPPWPDGVPRVGASVDGDLIDGPGLPLNANGQFDKSAFRYDKGINCYICPMGHKLRKYTNRKRRRKHPKIQYSYKCGECNNCQFKPLCAPGGHNRSISRNSDAHVHERHALRMKDSQRKEMYKLRARTVEPVFGIIKEAHRLRRFLTRGMESVKAEWAIASTAINIRKLINNIDFVAVAKPN